MKLQIDNFKKIALTGISLFFSTSFYAQVNQNNMVETGLYIAYGDSTMRKISSQNNHITKTTVLNGAIYQANRNMAKWEREYNNYLTTISSFTKQLKANTTLYLDAVRVMIDLVDLIKAVRDNPQGLVASGYMTDMYFRVATTFLQTFLLMKHFTDGGNLNMVSGADRVSYLWTLSLFMEQLDKDIRRATFCISCYTFEDVFYKAIAGKIEKTPGMVAAEAHHRMNNAMRALAHRTNW